MPPPPQALRHLLGVPYNGGGLAFSTSGTALLLATGGRLQQLDLTFGRARTLPFEATRDLKAISLSPRGDSVLTIDENDRTALISLPSGRVTARMSLRISGITSIAVSPCGTMAAFSTPEVTEIWKVPSNSVPQYAAFDRVAHYAKGAATRAALCWSKDSKHVAVGSRDGSVTVFTVVKEEERQGRIRPMILYGHRDMVVFVRFCGERGLVTMSLDGVLFCWRLRSLERPVGGGENGKGGMFKSFIPIEAQLMSRHFVRQGGAKRARCASLHDGMLVVGMSNGVFGLYQLPDEMAVKESDEFDQGLFEIREKEKMRRKKEKEGNGKKGKKRKKKNDGDGDSDGAEGKEDEEGKDEKAHIHFTDLTLLQTLSASNSAITDISFNASGEWIALASSQSGQVVVWEWRSETHILKQQAHLLSASAVAFSRDGRAIATGSKDGRVKLWGVATGFCVATFTEHESAISAITFAGNDVIVSASLDGTVRAFDIRRYTNFRIMVGPPPRRQFGCVAVDEGGELVAAGCVDTFEVIVWSLRTGQVVEILNGHKGPVSGISFRARRGTLITSSWDCSVRVWDMYERKGSCEVLEHSKEVLDVAFRPDGKEFASCTSSGEIVMWDVEKGSVTGSIDGGRDCASGRLRESRTVAEKKGYFESLCYSADGKFLIAGGGSKFVCVYHVSEGSRAILVDKVVITENQTFDGLLDRLNSKQLTQSGYVLDSIADDDVDGEDYGDARRAEKKSLPGAMSEQELRRKKLLKAEVKCVDVCASGRLWGVVTSEGVLVYGDEIGTEGGDEVFDPTNLDVEVTREGVREAVRKKDYVLGMNIALRLNERDSLNYVMDRVDVGDIELVVTKLPVLFFSRLVLLFAWRLEHTAHLQVNLIWVNKLMLVHGAQAHSGVTDPSSVNAALRALNRACAMHSKRLVPLADRNEHMLHYLISLASCKV